MGSGSGAAVEAVSVGVLLLVSELSIVSEEVLELLSLE